jgi:hypothetical protein
MCPPSCPPWSVGATGFLRLPATSAVETLPGGGDARMGPVTDVVLALDVGGTKLIGGLVAADGAVVLRRAHDPRS